MKHALGLTVAKATVVRGAGLPWLEVQVKSKKTPKIHIYQSF